MTPRGLMAWVRAQPRQCDYEGDDGSRRGPPVLRASLARVATHETEAVRDLRRENLAGLVGAGAGSRRGHRDELRLLPGVRRTGGRRGARARLRARPAPRPRGAGSGRRDRRDVEVMRRRGAVRRGGVLAGAVLGRRPRRRAATPVFVAAPGRGAAVPRACGQRRRAGPVAAVRRRDVVAEVVRQLPHASRYRALDRRRRIRGGHLPAEWTLAVWTPMPVSELALGRARRP